MKMKKRTLSWILSLILIVAMALPVMADQPEATYKIRIGETEHGTILCDQETAVKSESVTITVIPEEGYRLSYADFNGERYYQFHESDDVPGTYWCRMPDHDSTIRALFVPEDEYGVRVEKQIDGGDVELSRISGKTGDEITFTVNTKEDFLFNGVVYYAPQDGPVFELGSSAEGIYRFTIYESDVILTLEFEERPQKFQDIKKGSWYADAVDRLVNKKLMVGISETEFQPEGKVTRAQLCQTLFAMENKPERKEKGNPFSDVPVGKWYTEAVLWAKDNKLVTGYPDRTFKPNQTITREQTAVILRKYIEHRMRTNTETDRNELNRFTDGDMVSGYARDSMEWAVEQQIFSGTGKGKLEPKGVVTRAQLAVILHRVMFWLNP